MTARPALFILAGEASGDVIGADLMHMLRTRRDIEFQGVGGPEMQAEGLTSLFPMRDLSVMGFADVMKRLPLLLWRVRQTVGYIMRSRPDGVVLIDSQEFAALVARGLRRRGYTGRIILYVAPSVWAWRPERAGKIKSLFDEVLAVLPFEPQVMQQLGGPPCSYVGHPASSVYAGQVWNRAATGKLAMLPGSRTGEIGRHMSLFDRVVQRLANNTAIESIILPTLPHFQKDLREKTRHWPLPVEVVTGREARKQAFAQSIAALASAGTVSLELALAGVPMVGTYVPDKGQMHLYEKLGRPDVLLPNIIAGHRCVPEIPPGPDLTDRVANALAELLESAERRTAQQSEFEKIRDVMLYGIAGHKKEEAADRILFHLDQTPTG